MVSTGMCPLSVPRSGRKCAEKSASARGSVRAEDLEEPGAGKRPPVVGGPAGQPEGRSRLRKGHPGEEPELHQFGTVGVGGGKPFEGLVQVEEVVGGGRGWVGEALQVHPPPGAAALEPALVASPVDED